MLNSAKINFGFLAIAPLTLALLATPAQANVTTRCAIGPKEGQPSPLAIRATFVVEEIDGKNTVFRYQNLPTPVNAESPAATIEQERKLIIYDTKVAAARELLLKNSQYFNDLMGEPQTKGFKPFNERLVCQAAQASVPSSEPTSELPKASAGSTIADLADGSYRFWNGAAANNVTDEKLLAAGAFTFWFSKKGDRIVGYFARPSDYALCMTGTATGNTITGVVNPPAKFPNPAATQNKAYDPAGYLKLGAWDSAGNLGKFEPSTLNLTKFNRINLGTRSAPSLCR